jgi:two-component system sensor histidine kinase PilS (NtrC family)
LEARSKSDGFFDFTKSRGQLLVIEGVRLGFLLAILLITLAFQAFQPEFVNVDVLLPVYALMAVSFILNAMYLVAIEEALKYWVTTAFLFAFDAAFITCLIYFTGINQSIFLFLYLINIILCGFVFQRAGALVLALWTSILFSFLIIMGPDLKGQTLFFAIGLNNIAFFAVAVLSGFLSEQLNFMGNALREQGQNIRALRNLNALIVDNIATGLITTDLLGNIVVANRAAIETLVPLSEKIIGQHIDAVIPGMTGTIAALTFSGESAERFDLAYRNADDEKLTLEMIVSRLPSENSIAGFILTFQDLTKVRRLESQMRQSEKMAAVGQLAAGIAHEIRNPLASISGSIQLLGASFSGRQEDEQRLMSISMREVDRLNNLITEFLDFVRPDALKDDPVSLTNVVRDVLEVTRFNKSLRSDVKVNTDLGDVPAISGHSDKLKQAFLNIIINAYQAMKDSAEPQLDVSVTCRDSKVIVKIKDHGCGIDEKGLRKIFEPFHTTKPKGTGLGLAVTHKIIESHGGRIFVESSKNVGTEFILEFPVRTEKGVDKNALADSQLASENFSIAFRGQKRGNG